MLGASSLMVATSIPYRVVVDHSGVFSTTSVILLGIRLSMNTRVFGKRALSVVSQKWIPFPTALKFRTGIRNPAWCLIRLLLFFCSNKQWVQAWFPSGATWISQPSTVFLGWEL